MRDISLCISLFVLLGLFSTVASIRWAHDGERHTIQKTPYLELPKTWPLLSLSAALSISQRPQEALRVSTLAARINENNPDIHFYRSNLFCAAGAPNQALASAAKGLSLRRGSAPTNSFEEFLGSNPAVCHPLPLLFPFESVFQESVNAGAFTRWYYVLNEGRQSIVKQTTGLTSAREGYILSKLARHSGGDEYAVHNDGCFPRAIDFGDSRQEAELQGQAPTDAPAQWSWCQIEHLDNLVSIEEYVKGKPPAVAAAFLHDLLTTLQLMQDCGVRHNNLNADSVKVLPKEGRPFIFNFEYAIADKMPYPNYWEGKAQPHSDIQTLGRLLVSIGHFFPANIRPILEKIAAANKMEVGEARFHLHKGTGVGEGNIALPPPPQMTLDGSLTYLPQAVPLKGDPPTLVRAKEIFEEIHTAFPTNGIPYNNLGSTYFELNRFEEALKNFEKALELELPHKYGVLCNIYALRIMLCEWDHRDEDMITIRKMINEDLYAYALRAVYMLALPLPQELNYKMNIAIAKYAIPKLPEDGIPLMVPTYPMQLLPDHRIRVGILSSDVFTQHAVAASTHSVWMMLDPMRVDIVFFITRPEQREGYLGEGYGSQSCKGDWPIVDVVDLRSDKAAIIVNNERPHVIVDMNGHTGIDDNMGTLSYKPAPVQLHYLGYPSTTGATYIDYMTTDKVVSPPDFAPYYSEKLYMMPHCFQVVSHRQEHPRPPQREHNIDPTFKWKWGDRAQHKMPLTGPLLCNSNQLFKLDQDMFDTWLRLLIASPNATLLLVHNPKAAEPRLRARMRALGVPDHRLQWLPKVELRIHLRRLSCCTLFLDNREYNSGTTATDALWAGVPVITLPREKHSARHVASMLRVMGAGNEMIVRDLQDYEDVAKQMLRTWERQSSMSIDQGLAGIRYRIMRRRLENAVLFDTLQWTRDSERAWRMMWDIWEAGRAGTQGGRPMHLKVAAEGDGANLWDGWGWGAGSEAAGPFQSVA